MKSTPREKVYKLLKKITPPVSEKDMKMIFLEALGDYYKKKIDLTYLATLATELYYELNKPSDFDVNPQMQKLGNVLSIATEIDYYHKQSSKDPKMGKMYDTQIRVLREFYNENKHLFVRKAR